MTEQVTLSDQTAANSSETPTDVQTGEAFADALTVLRAGVDDSYGDRVERSSCVIKQFHEADLPGVDVVGHPGVEQAIWRYQNLSADDVRSRIEKEVDADAEYTASDVVEALCTVVEKLPEAGAGADEPAGA
jgi:hypothetical protein